MQTKWVHLAYYHDKKMRYEDSNSRMIWKSSVLTSPLKWNEDKNAVDMLA